MVDPETWIAKAWICYGFSVFSPANPAPIDLSKGLIIQRLMGTLLHNRAVTDTAGWVGRESETAAQFCKAIVCAFVGRMVRIEGYGCQKPELSYEGPEGRFRFS